MAVSSHCVPVTGAAHPFPYPGFGRSFRPMQRQRRRPFHPVTGNSPYQLPKALQDRLGSALAGFRNAEAAFALAVFLARFWSSPGRLDLPFPIDRRALTDHRELGLTEGQVRGAIQTLERVGFLDRPIAVKGSAYRRKGDNLHRKPTLFAFGVDYRDGFDAANRRTKAKRVLGQPVVRDARMAANLPKDKGYTEKVLLMGYLVPISPKTPNLGLEDALTRLKEAIGLR